MSGRVYEEEHILDSRKRKSMTTEDKTKNKPFNELLFDKKRSKELVFYYFSCE